MTTGKQIAFSARVTEMQVMNFNSTIVFNDELINDGNGYDKSTGVFTAPASGVYYFMYTLELPFNNSGFMNASLKVDDRVLCGSNLAIAAVTEGTTSGNSSILHVSEGQKVYVNYIEGYEQLSGNEKQGYSTFCGYLLYEK